MGMLLRPKEIGMVWCVLQAMGLKQMSNKLAGANVANQRFRQQSGQHVAGKVANKPATPVPYGAQVFLLSAGQWAQHHVAVHACPGI